MIKDIINLIRLYRAVQRRASLPWPAKTTPKVTVDRPYGSVKYLEDM